jgi:hypothetical protein
VKTRARRVAAGLCIDCAQVNGSGRQRCHGCTEVHKARERQRVQVAGLVWAEYRIERRRQKRERGECYDCSTQAYRDRVRCFTCLRKAAALAAARRDPSTTSSVPFGETCRGVGESDSANESFFADTCADSSTSAFVPPLHATGRDS